MLEDLLVFVDGNYLCCNEKDYEAFGLYVI